MKLWQVFRGLVFVILVLVLGACTPVLPPNAEQQPVTDQPVVQLIPVCSKPTELPPTENTWAYSRTMRLVPSTDQVEFPRAVAQQSWFYTYNPRADPDNSRLLPIPHNKLPCIATKAKGPLVKRSKGYLIAGKFVPIVPPAPCVLLRENALALFEPVPSELRADLREPERLAAPDGRWIAQSVRAGAAHPDPVRLKQDIARSEAVNLSYGSGDKFGSTIAGIESGLNTLSSGCSRFEEDLRENPQILADIQQKIAKTLNDIPLPPQYSEPELQGLALVAFSRGFEHGFGFKKLQFLALNTSATVSIFLFPNIYLAAETAAAKAVRLAFERVRTIPIYVPVMTNGAGFFMKLPKAPPANVNGPAVPVVRPPPVVTPPPPPQFGNLSRAAEFGVLTEGKMAKALAGTSLQRHHLFEQRFGIKMDGDPRMKLTIAVTEAEHQAFTNAWRREIGYGLEGTFSRKFERAEIIAAARRIYKDYPAILKALDL